MNYTLLILPKAEKELASLPKDRFLLVDAHIMALRKIPRPPGCIKLKGREGWRIRAGEYRVIYEIKDAERTVVIHHVAHRKEVYR